LLAIARNNDHQDEEQGGSFHAAHYLVLDCLGWRSARVNFIVATRGRIDYPDGSVDLFVFAVDLTKLEAALAKNPALRQVSALSSGSSGRWSQRSQEPGKSVRKRCEARTPESIARISR
jgi:hypothetical protein